MTDFSFNRLSSRSLMSQSPTRGMASSLPSHPSLFVKNRALGVFFVLFFGLFVTIDEILAASPREEEEIVAGENSMEEFENKFSLKFHSGDLCAWERELGFFLSKSNAEEKSERIDCALRLKNEDTVAQVGEMKEEFQSGDQILTKELDELVAGFPIESMTKAIARYDREIAGLIVGIGKKESNWGKRTPKLDGEECFNFWGYRGAGTKGFTSDGYGCWNTPEEAVKTIGDRLEKLRDLRLSTEPARMIVWKCGSTCAGHSDESVRKWIADVNIYYRKIAQK